MQNSSRELCGGNQLKRADRRQIAIRRLSRHCPYIMQHAVQHNYHYGRRTVQDARVAPHCMRYAEFGDQTVSQILSVKHMQRLSRRMQATTE